jgi:hypothetical protein
VQILDKTGGLKETTLVIKLDTKYSRRRLDLMKVFIETDPGLRGCNVYFNRDFDYWTFWHSQILVKGYKQVILDYPQLVEILINFSGAISQNNQK